MALDRQEDNETIYGVYRAYIEHEDELVHQRTTSLVTIQSFVLATFGFTYQKKYEVAARLLEANKTPADLGSIVNEYNGFLLALALVGIATSFIAWRSIRAAITAIYHLRDKWVQVSRDMPATHLPGITGGGSAEASKAGVSLASWAPLFLLGFWATTLFVLLFVFDIRVTFR